MSLDARGLVERFGSPLFVYDGDMIRARHAALRAALPERVSLFYAMKANPSLGILALLRSLGCGVEIASRGELVAAQRAGFASERILNAGPGKTDVELEAAAEADIRAIHAESEGELLRLDAIGRRRGRPVRAGLRVHVPWTAREARTIIGGTEATKFGIPEEAARERAGAWARLPGVRLSSLHVFNASNVLDAGALVAGARRTCALAQDLIALGLPLEAVDLGGGLGVPYSESEAELDVGAFGRGLADLPGAFRLAVEPGRWLVAPAGRYLVTVTDVKPCAGVEFVVVDGGIHHLLRPALVGQPHRVEAVSVSAGPRGPRRVVGPLCTALDTFGDHDLPPVHRGDVLAVTCAGAYGYTEAMPAFLSHAVPAEVMLLDGREHLLRPRREPEWHLEGQVMPEGL